MWADPAAGVGLVCLANRGTYSGLDDAARALARPVRRRAGRGGMRDWSHCPRCGAPLGRSVPPGDDEERLYCPACGLVLYENPAPTASAVARRRAGPGDADPARHRAVPGHVGPARRVRASRARTAEQAARRELLEETGLEIGSGRCSAIVPDVYGAGGEPTLNIFYLASVAAGTPRPASDVSEIGWFAPGELPRGRPDCVCLRREALERARGEPRLAHVSKT